MTTTPHITPKAHFMWPISLFLHDEFQRHTRNASSPKLLCCDNAGDASMAGMLHSRKRYSGETHGVERAKADPEANAHGACAKPIHSLVSRKSFGVPRYPITGIGRCCALAARGQAASLDIPCFNFALFAFKLP
jgi:hypothetical protein